MEGRELRGPESPEPLLRLRSSKQGVAWGACWTLQSGVHLPETRRFLGCPVGGPGSPHHEDGRALLGVRPGPGVALGRAEVPGTRVARAFRADWLRKLGLRR